MRHNQVPQKPKKLPVQPSRVAAWTELDYELQRLMPRRSGAFGSRYTCKICGSAVDDRIVHFRWHQNTVMTETLRLLFVEES